MELQGYVVVALTVALLGYLLPHLVRSRQLVLESRVDDRYSAHLRILATAGATSAAGPGAHRSTKGRLARTKEPAGPDRTSAGHHTGTPARPYLHDPTRRPEGPMNRPQPRERATEDARALAAARAARAARVARRAAAARRRLVLTVVLLIAAAGLWAAFAMAAAPWWAAAIPTVLLATVLVMGRRTAVRAAAHDKRDRAEMARLEARLREVSKRSDGERRAARAASPRTGSTSAGSTRAGSTRAGSMRSGSAPATATRAAGGPVSVAVATAAATTAADTVGAPDVKPSAEAASDDVRPLVERAPGRAAGGTTEEWTDEAATARDLEPTDDDALPDNMAPASPDDAEPWTPVPLPAPTYTMKPAAPRRDVAPYTSEVQPGAPVPQRPTAASPSTSSVVTEEPAPPAAPIDLDAVLARRRAAAG